MCTDQIADFGVSEDVKQTEGQLTRWAGTPAFQAPEVLEGKRICITHSLAA